MVLDPGTAFTVFLFAKTLFSFGMEAYRNPAAAGFRQNSGQAGGGANSGQAGGGANSGQRQEGGANSGQRGGANSGQPDSGKGGQSGSGKRESAAPGTGGTRPGKNQRQKIPPAYINTGTGFLKNTAVVNSVPADVRCLAWGLGHVICAPATRRGRGAQITQHTLYTGAVRMSPHKHHA